MKRGRTTAMVILAGVVVVGCARKEPSQTQNDTDANGAFRPLQVGLAAPAYTATTLDGDTIQVGGSQPPTVLNVWATWCTTCVAEMSALDSLSREFGPRGVRVVAISTDDGDAARVRQFVRVHHLGLTIIHDSLGSIERRYGVVGLPTTFVISRTGQLVWIHTGDIDDVMRDARQVLSKLATTPVAAERRQVLAQGQ